MKDIKSFDGEYRFLSNFYESPITVDGIDYPTLEHIYQASKAIDPQQKEKISNAKSPYIAKKLGKICKCVPNWDNTKLRVMEKLIRIKFSKDPLKTKLLETGDSELVERNWWGDTFWGVHERTGVGQNHLGKILMEVREELKTGTSLKWN